jgi:hypothetical protein
LLLLLLLLVQTPARFPTQVNKKGRKFKRALVEAREGNNVDKFGNQLPPMQKPPEQEFQPVGTTVGTPSGAAQPAGAGAADAGAGLAALQAGQAELREGVARIAAEQAAQAAALSKKLDELFAASQ